MNNIIRIFKYSGFSLIFIALLSFGIQLVSAIGAYKNGILSVKVIYGHAKPDVKVIDGIKFTNSQIGVMEIKPTLMQAIFLSDKEIRNNGANVIFYFVLGIVILVIAYNRPRLLEELTENRLWQFVGAGVILFIGLMFLVSFLADNYIETLTHHNFKQYHPSLGGGNLNTLSLVMVINIIYQLLSYSKKLKEENDLTI